MTVARGRGRPSVESVVADWSGPAILTLLVGIGGFAMAGDLGALVGLISGAAAVRRPQAVLIASAAALFAAAALVVLEQPLDVDLIPRFPRIRPLAELAAWVAAVLLLAGLAGTYASRRTAKEDQATEDSSLGAVPAAAPSTGSGVIQSLSTSTITAFLAAVVLGALVLWRIGDRRWEAVAPLVALGALGLGAALPLADRVRSRPTRWFALVPTSMAALSGLRRDHRHMLGGSAWLLAATATVSLGSFAFWLLAAQRVPADDVGRAAALFSASLFICYLTSLGLPVAVSRYAPDRTQSSATLFAWSLVLRLGSSLAGVAVFFALAPASFWESLAAWRPGLAWVAVSLLVAGQSISELVDVRLMVLRRWPLVFLRSLMVAVIRLPFLFWVPGGGVGFYVYAVAMGGFAITGIIFLAFLAQPGWLRLRPLPDGAKRAMRFAGVNYLGQLAVQAPYFVVPVVVLLQVDAVDNARFYLSWGAMSVIYVGIQMVAQAFLVEGGRGGSDPRHQAALSLRAGLATATVATALSLGAGPFLAGLYGPAYGPVATLLPLLVAGTIPFALTMTLLTLARIREHSDITIAVAASFAVAVLVPTVLLTASDGSLGAAWGWTLGNALAAALALLFARWLNRVGSVRARPMSEAASTAAAPQGP